MMILGKFPDHNAAKAAVARLAYFALAGTLIVVGNKFVVDGAGIINTQVSGLRRRVPVVKITLVIGGHDGVIAWLGRRRGRAPAFEWEGDAAVGGSRAAAPNPAVKSNANAESPRRDARAGDALNHPIRRRDEAARAGEPKAAIINGRVKPCHPARVGTGEIISHEIDLVELALKRG